MIASARTPVVELLRVSTELQAAENRAGLAAQHSTNVATGERLGLEIVETVEVVESGAEVARSPAMARVMEAITERRARGVLLAEYSRLFRPDRWSDLVVLQTLSDHDAPIYLPSGPIDLQSELGFVQATINNLLAAMERRRIRERMDRGKEEHRRRGAHVAGGIGIPFGMRWSREQGWAWTEDAAVVRELFRRFLAGERNYDALGRSLGLARTTTKFLLTNPVYTGWRIYDERRDLSAAGKYPGGERRTVPRRPEEVIRVRLPLEPLVSEADFALVQDLVATKRSRTVRRVTDEEFLYRGLLECTCGLAMYTKYSTRRGLPPKHFYYCRSRHPQRRPAGVEPCPTGYLVRAKLEALLDRAVARRLTDVDVLVSALAAHLEHQVAAARSAAPDREGLSQRLIALEQKRERILESYYDGLISKAERDRRLAPVTEAASTTGRLLGAPAPAEVETLTEAAALALVRTFARWRRMDRLTRRGVLEDLSPTFYVGKYRVAGVRFPLAPLTGRHTDGHSPTSDRVTTSYALVRAPGGLYVPLSA